MRDAAQRYLAAGLCVLPALRDQKRPTVRWKPFQSRLPTQAEVDAWFANEQTGMCILTGKVSGNHECVDFDQAGAMFAAWSEEVRAAKPGLLERLVISKTQRDGRHVGYCVECEVSGNLKLAQRKGDDGKVVTLIETRGEGGLYLCAPTLGYEVLQGDLCRLPVITAEERDILLQCAWDLNEYVPPVVDGPDGTRKGATPVARSQQGPTSGQTGPTVGLRPGDDYSLRGNVRAVLLKHGWQCTRGGDNEHWRRPDKTSGSNSATLKDGVFYVFSSNAAPFEPNRPYSPFAVYTLLEHGGNWEEAARALRELGYGGDCTTDGGAGVDISTIVGQAAAVSAENAAACVVSETPLEIRPLRELLHDFTGLHPPVIRGLLREGETMNIIASPKVGKSWLVSGLVISVASGLDWLGFGVEQGCVLHIDNELHLATTTYRYRVISEAMGIDPRLYDENIDVVSLRGQLRDLQALGRYFAGIEPGTYRLVVIDAFYRTLPRDTDENDNGAIAGLYNLIDYYAARLGCAFVLIHHSSKGNQAGKSVTDVGAGAGSQSRAADTHLVLRPHEEPGVFIAEAAVRSWPPIEPLALKFEWPLFTPTTVADVSALMGTVKPRGGKADDVSLEDFVGQCVSLRDPCSQRSVKYEARHRFGLSDRKAEEMLDLAKDRGLIARIRAGAHVQYVKNRPGVTGEKGQWVAAILSHGTEQNAQEIADKVGVSRQYVNRVRRQIDGNCVETDGN